MSDLAPVHSHFLPLTDFDPIYAAVLGNMLCGIGVLILFRHGGSLGGFNVVALLLQEKWGWRAGYVLMVTDLLVVCASIATVSIELAIVSAGGALLLNLIVAQNHRQGRYIA
ncbi:YitT family protein [Microbacterium sp. NPDC008134]|uniref:YitT family protein n=1 Tax=Microbacterium sp. NPDC008134 TaxID=3364183 RepID=UPI0036F0230E